MTNQNLQNACVELSNSLQSHTITNSTAYDLTTELINSVINCSRTSLWMFNATHTKSICKSLFIRDENSHSRGQVISRRTNPSYFDALETTKCVVAGNAKTHQATKGLYKQYLEPKNILSQMSLPIILSNEIVGIICNEECVHPRDWTIHDIILIQEMCEILEPIFESLI